MTPPNTSRTNSMYCEGVYHSSPWPLGSALSSDGTESGRRFDFTHPNSANRRANFSTSGPKKKILRTWLLVCTLPRFVGEAQTVPGEAYRRTGFEGVVQPSRRQDIHQHDRLGHIAALVLGNELVHEFNVQRMRKRRIQPDTAPPVLRQSIILSREVACGLDGLLGF